MNLTPDLEIVYLDPHDLTPYEGNARKHGDVDVQGIKDSIETDGFNDPIGIWGDENLIVEGHGRQLAAIALGMEKVPCIRLDHLTDAQRRDYAIRHNRTAELSEWDEAKKQIELEALEMEGFDVGDLFDADECVPTDKQSHKDNLNNKFLIAPFSVLDARSGRWRERKEDWRNIIGDDGQARETAKAFSLKTGDDTYGIASKNGTSILDPVLSEIICKWFTPSNCSAVFDCFAGDSVFGFVSAYLGHTFTGIELRQEQVEFNENAVVGLAARYICDDGQNVADHIERGSQDLFFSCPPYYDLEQYSDLPQDASNQETYEEFYAIIDKAFSESIKCLKNDRFAVIVCGDVRDKKTGAYYGFPDDIKQTFKKNGMILYNEMILVDPVGTAAIRAGKYMQVRKVAKVHQNVLVFYKGKPANIRKTFPEIEVQVDESTDMEL